MYSVNLFNRRNNAANSPSSMDRTYNNYVKKIRAQRRQRNTHEEEEPRAAAAAPAPESLVDDIDAFMGEESLAVVVDPVTYLLQKHKARLERIFSAHSGTDMRPNWQYIEHVMRLLCRGVPSFDKSKISDTSWLSEFNRQLLNEEWDRCVDTHRETIIVPFYEESKSVENHLSVMRPIIEAFEKCVHKEAHLVYTEQRAKMPSAKKLSKLNEGMRILRLLNPHADESTSTSTSDEIFQITVINKNEQRHVVLDLYIDSSVSPFHVFCVKYFIHFLMLPWYVIELRKMMRKEASTLRGVFSRSSEIISTCFGSALRAYRATAALRTNGHGIVIL